MSKKQPRLVLRESCIFDVAGTWKPGNFLETGAGTGKMTQLFLDRGFHGTCYELGQTSRQMLRQNLRHYGARMRVVDDLAELQAEEFDYLFSFEVLEHIEDDEATLRQWTAHLRAGGMLLISVPSRASKYGKSDEIVGHVRRYEKSRLTEMLRRHGYAEIQIASYGFPLTEISRRISNWMVRNETVHLDLSLQQRSVQSSYRRPDVINKGVALFGGAMIRPFCTMQRLFYRADLGDGYVASARKARQG